MPDAFGSLTDRIKMNRRGTQTQRSNDDTIDLTESPRGVAHTNASSEIIELRSSSDDELSITTTKTRVKAVRKPRAKMARALPSSPDDHFRARDSPADDLPPITALGPNDDPSSSSLSNYTLNADTAVKKPAKKARKKKEIAEGEKPAKQPRQKKTKKVQEENEDDWTKKEVRKGKRKAMEEDESAFKSNEFVHDTEDEGQGRPPDLPGHDDLFDGALSPAPVAEEEVLPGDKRRPDEDASVSPMQKKKARKTRVVDSDEEEEGTSTAEKRRGGTDDEVFGGSNPRKKSRKDQNQAREQSHDDPFKDDLSPPKGSVDDETLAASAQKVSVLETPRAAIGKRTKSTPMSELIRKVNSRPDSPFPVTVPRSRSSLGTVPPGTPVTSYSPYAKFSRRALSRIAPLHPNRRTPPPPLPPLPPKPKTKKEKEMEERWEEEMIEAYGGWDAWKQLTEQEQKVARREKWRREQEGWD
ncbi:unnamed protein product [Mycena citricolor]|uniref:Uncharacterized protein n=1 Tax=Mycena citricolor TaxID=2018698 RepID=A0AAD2H5B5_9AGAR|nr:unnamed protein product [Mycena citricolor]